MAHLVIIDSQITVQPAVAFLRGLVGDDVRPLRQESFDEPFRLAVGLQRVGLGADRSEFQGPAGFSPVIGAVGGAVVREDPSAGDPLLREPADCAGQETNSRRPLLVGEHLDVGQAGGVVDGDVHLFVAGAS